MKRPAFLAVLLIAAAPASISRATLVFSENVGTPGATTGVGTYTGWQNNGTLTFSGTADVRTSGPSSGYAGASGSGNVFFTNSGTASVQIAAIDTSSYTGTFDLAFGALKTLNASDMTELALAFSPDGATYTPIVFPAQPTGTGTAVWRLISLTGITLPAVTNLRLRWTDTATTASLNFRVDDISLNGTLSSVPEASAFIYGGLFCGVAILWTIRSRRRMESGLV